MRLRSKYILLCICILMIAVLSRELFSWMFLPDALSATFFYFFFRIILPRKSARQVFLLTFACCILVEFSQLWQAALLNRLREIRLVHYIIGHNFDPVDIVAYFAGTVLAYWLDKRLSN